MAYKIIINAGKRQFTKLVGLAAGLLAALRKKKKHTVLNVDIGDDAVVYTKGDKMLAFAKRWLPVFSQQPTLETLNRLGDEGRVFVYGNVPNVLMRAFQNGVIISIRHPDGTWGNVAGTAPYDEVIIPEFRDQTQPPLYSQRAVYLIKASADGTTICLLADTCLDTVTGYVRAQLMSPVTLEYSGGGWQAAVPVTGERVGRDHAVDVTDGQTVAVFGYDMDGLNIWSCRGTPAWQHTLNSFMPPITNEHKLAVADGYVLFTGFSYADWIGPDTGAAVWAGILYTDAGTTSTVYDSGVLEGVLITIVGASGGEWYGMATFVGIDRNPNAYDTAYAIITRVGVITGYVRNPDTGVETHSGTVTTVVVAAGVGGSVSTLYSDTYEGVLRVSDGGTSYAAPKYPEISLSAADTFDAAVSIIINSHITVYSRGANGAWTQDMALDVGGSVAQASSNLIGYRTPPPYTSTIRWNGSESISQSGFCLMSRETVSCRPHGAFYENRPTDGNISIVLLRQNEAGSAWLGAALVRDSDGRYTEVCRFSAPVDEFNRTTITAAASPDLAVVAVLRASSATVVMTEVYVRSGGTYERVYSRAEANMTTPYGGFIAEVAADGTQAMFGVLDTLIVLRVKQGTLEEGEKRVVEADRVLVGFRGVGGTSAYPLVFLDIPDEGVFFNAQTGQAFQTITRPLIHVAPRPTMIEPENGAPYVFGDNTVLEYRLAPPASNDTGGSEEV